MNDVQLKTEIPTQRAAFLLGAIVQGMVLGTLLAVALLMISAWSGGIRSFRYEGF
jgi:hypothetical protein